MVLLIKGCVILVITFTILSYKHTLFPNSHPQMQFFNSYVVKEDSYLLARNLKISSSRMLYEQKKIKWQKTGRLVKPLG